MLDTSAWDNVADMVRTRGFLSSRSPAHFRCHRRARRQRQAVRRRHRVRAARANWASWRTPAGSLTSARSRVTRPRPPTCARMRSSCASARCCGSSSRRAPRSPRSVFNTEGHTARDLVDKAEQKVFEIAEAGFGGARRRGVRAQPAAGAHRQDRRVALESRCAARPAHRLRGLRQDHRRAARRRPRHRRRPAVDGQDARSR